MDSCCAINAPAEMVTVSGSLTLTKSYIGRIVICTSATAVTLTLPQYTSDPIFFSFWCSVYQAGAGQITFAVEGTDVLESRGAKYKTAGQFAGVQVFKRTTSSPGIYCLLGDLSN